MELKIFNHISSSCYSNSSSTSPFTTEEITGCTNEVAKGVNKAPRNPASWGFFISCLTGSLTLSINGFMILILSFLFSF